MPFGPVAAGVGAAASAAMAVNSIAGGGGPTPAANAAGAASTADLQQAADLWNNLQTPNIQFTPYQKNTWLQDYVPTNYQPYEGQATQIQDSPEMRAQEVSDLGQLNAFGQGGLQPADIAALNQTENSELGAGTAAAQGVVDNLRSRGVGGAGAEEVARLAGDQTAANSAGTTYANVMQQALARQLASINQAATLSGNVRNQDVGVSTTMAGIANNFNTQVQQLRTDAAKSASANANQATLYNEAGKQQTADTNTGLTNQDIERQTTTIPQLNFTNQESKIAGQGNALIGQAQNSSAQQAALNAQSLGQQQSTIAALGALGSNLNTLNKTTQTGTSPSTGVIGNALNSIFGGTGSTGSTTPTQYSGSGTNTPGGLPAGGGTAQYPVDNADTTGTADYFAQDPSYAVS